MFNKSAACFYTPNKLGFYGVDILHKTQEIMATTKKDTKAVDGKGGKSKSENVSKAQKPTGAEKSPTTTKKKEVKKQKE